MREAHIHISIFIYVKMHTELYIYIYICKYVCMYVFHSIILSNATLILNSNCIHMKETCKDQNDQMLLKEKKPNEKLLPQCNQVYVGGHIRSFLQLR